MLNEIQQFVIDASVEQLEVKRAFLLNVLECCTAGIRELANNDLFVVENELRNRYSETSEVGERGDTAMTAQRISATEANKKINDHLFFLIARACFANKFRYVGTGAIVIDIKPAYVAKYTDYANGTAGVRIMKSGVRIGTAYICRNELHFIVNHDMDNHQNFVKAFVKYGHGF